MNVPCGCAERKDVMFDQGNPDLGLALIVGVPLALLLIVLYIQKGS